MIKFLREKEIIGIDMDSVKRLEIHRRVLQRKPMLLGVFTECHKWMHSFANKHLTVKGYQIELGAGAVPMRDIFSGILATDIEPAPYLDKVLDAENMDLPDSSVRVFYGQNCFHHFPHPERFFHELRRVLIPGGGAVLLEPYYGPISSLIHKRIFTTEGFDKAASSWESNCSGAMMGANQALSYIVFIRDRALFEKKYPDLQVVDQYLMHNYLKYLLSGGLNFKQLWPSRLSFVLDACQWALKPINNLLALHHIIVIKKCY